MDYEKMYKAVLKTAKQWFKDSGSDKIKLCLKCIFPELRESEDERIRKEMIDFLKSEKAFQTIDLPISERWVAYLEKQKEQKPSEYLSKDKVYAIMSKLTNLSYSSLIPLNSDEYKKINEITSDVRSLLDYPVERKPAEWSKEDERMIDTIVSVLSQYIDYKAVSGTGSGYATPRYNKEIDWLKSLRPQPKQEQNDYITPHKEFFKFIYDRLINVHKENPNVDYMRSFKERLNNLSFGEKQEWSEEDEEMLNSCISSIEEAKENRYAYKETDGDTSYDHEINWLKSLRPSWKPSEEQMKALQRTVNKLANTDTADSVRLSIIYDNLKKLM